MKKYLAILILSFVLVSCGKHENKQVISEFSENTELEISNIENNIIVENNSISNTGEIMEVWIGEKIEESLANFQEKEEKVIDTKKWWEEYKNTQYWFSISYPKQAYLDTKCWTGTKDELIDLKIFQKDNNFIIWYWKKLSNCKLIDVNSFEELDNIWIYFSIYNSKDVYSFVKENISEICKIDKIKQWAWNTNLEQIFIVMKTEIRECIEKNICNQYNVYTCSEPFYTLFDWKISKGVRIWYSNSDYFIQKYPTYQETMEKWSYDKEIINTFKFE